VAVTDPWDVLADSRIRGPIRHVVEVTAEHSGFDAPIPLDVVTGTLTFDERGEVHVTASLGCAVPDVATLDALDPRKRVQVRIRAGYRYPGGVEDVHDVALLDLRSRVVTRPDDRMVLTAEGLECRLRDAIVLGPTTYTSSDDAGTVLAARIATFAPSSGDVVNTLPATAFLEGSDTITEAVGDNPWNLQRDVMDRAECICYWNGLEWRIEPDFALTGLTSHLLTVGNGGTITGSESSLTRDGFYNLVFVRHKWASLEAYGWAAVDAGDLGTAAVGTRAIVLERAYAGSEATATAAAVALVKRGISRGRSVSVETGAAAWWVRPGRTVQVRLLTGEAERHLVERVDFDLTTGGMHVLTRLPETVTIETGE